jgi:hypothetical protein
MDIIGLERLNHGIQNRRVGDDLIVLFTSKHDPNDHRIKHLIFPAMSFFISFYIQRNAFNFKSTMKQ